MHKRAALLGTSLLLVACGGSSKKSRSYQAPTAASVVQELQERQAKTSSFLAESRMEYWFDDQRIKTTVYVMGKRGARVRFNALNPTGGDVAADLACDGNNFTFVDYNNNCEMTGPCTKMAIAQLLRVSLEPDDFLVLAVGSTPIIPFDEGKVKWDGKKAQEVVELATNDGKLKQTIILDGRKQHWDVLSSTVWDADGKIDWKLTNKEFSDHEMEGGGTIRLPARTRFEQPKAKADLTIRWDENNVNIDLPEDKFQTELQGLAVCGRAPGP